MKKEPFTKQEKEISDLIIKAHNKFIKLKENHPSELNEWLISIHRLQDLLGARVLRRDYPNTFYSIKESYKK